MTAGAPTHRTQHATGGGSGPGGGAGDNLFGDAGDDDIHGGPAADPNITPGAPPDGADTIAGGDGNDNIEGEAGNDQLYGDEVLTCLADGAGTGGVDTVIGGLGNDHV